MENMDLIEAIARLSRMMRRRGNEKETLELSHMGHHVLRIIKDHDGICATRLAELAGVRPASITESVNRLEKLGYVVRRTDDEDSRVKRICITDKTREHIEAHTKVKQERNEKMLSCLTKEEADEFLAICNKLYAFMEKEEW
ncbi:MAG: MarR family transcriptional regulator [Lachnospiraceae bacterium]|nr:MarR family transcriptional regulator [Lachnospiraceae bacterium]